jgi:hypothetical protein
MKVVPIPSGYKRLPGSERPQDPGSTLIGPVEKAERVAATLLLRVRRDAPAEHDFEHWQNTPPGKRQFLSAEQYMQTYGSTEEDVKAVIDFLESKGLSVVESSAGRRRIVAEGDAAKINDAFAIVLNWYRAPHTVVTRPVPRREGLGTESQTSEQEVYRGFEGPVHLPSELSEVVSAVIGLNNRRLGHPMGTGTGDPPAANFLSPAAVAQLYNFPNTGAAGQTIGIFENAGGGAKAAAYLHSDIAAFISSLPAGYNTQPANLTDIGLTVSGTTYGNNTSLVTSSPTPAVGECVVDVSIAAAVSQGANINVYFTDTSEAGWEAFLNRAIIPQPGDNPPSVLTASWVFKLDDHQATIGNPASSGSAANWITVKMKQAATRGITVFMAIGDWGSADLVVDGSCHIAYPNGDPGVTACGGTIVGNITPTSFEEFAWSDAHTTSPFQNFPYVSTGGGVSDNTGFPVPPYQTAAGVLPISKNDGNSRRGVPDVAGMVAMDGFFFAGVGGPGQFAFIGTSLVAPLYAGLIAVINAFWGRNAGFLNPTLYTYGPEICNDVRFGDNDSGNGPVPADAPFYVAGPGWDLCTGWGSINGFRLRAALVPAPIIVTAIASAGDFGNVCLNSFADEILTINNTGFSLLLISNITSSSTDFVIPAVASYPLAVGPGGSMDIVIRFQPSSLGASSATLTFFSNDLLGPHIVSVSGFTQAPRLVLAIADNGRFSDVCLGKFADEPLVLSNGGRCPLSVTSISISSGEFVVPVVVSFPIAIAPGASIALPVRFEPGSFGAKSATLSVFSDDPASPGLITVSGDAPAPRLVLAIANSGHFGTACIGSFVDEPLILNNSGPCVLTITGITTSSAEFQVPQVVSYPISIGPGDSLPLPIRFSPTSIGPASSTLTIASNDPASPQSIVVTGDAPSGKLAVTGSTCFGGVKACCSVERTISICNVGDCKLHVSSVELRHRNRHWKLINNPFPATLHPGSCLGVVIRYKATEKCPRSCDLIIHSDDPGMPVKFLEVVAYTIWPDCGCRKCCEDCRKGTCEKRHCDPCCCQKCHDDCCDKEDNDEDGDD